MRQIEIDAAGAYCISLQLLIDSFCSRIILRNKKNHSIIDFIDKKKMIKRRLFTLSNIAAAMALCFSQQLLAHEDNAPQTGLEIAPIEVAPKEALTRDISAINPPTPSVELPTEAKEEITNSQVKLPQDLWDRIRAGYAIPDIDTPLVANQLKWYASRADYIQRTIQRGSRYLYHVVEELEKRGMPMELALLPFIESAFNPRAVSSAKAAGMWQFMPATGKDFNLKQNMFTDERRGVIDSTDAALNYLERLHGMFGDWQLALAAYNWGEGSVQRAIKKQQARGLPVNYVSMSKLMPLETQNYVPKLQAVKNIIADPKQYGLELESVENQPYFVSVEKTRDIDVRIAAQLAELSVSEFNALNPQFNRPVITGNADTKILLPLDNANLFRENLNKWQGSLSSWSAYHVAKTERIESLSQRLNVAPSLLMEVNFIPAKTLVKSGSTILVPKTEKSPDEDIANEVAENARLIFEKQTPSHRVVIRARKNDSLNLVASRHGVTTAQIKSWNGLKQDKLVAGQKLVVMIANHNDREPVRSALVQKQTKRSALVKNGTNKNVKAKTIVASAKVSKKPHG